MLIIIFLRSQGTARLMFNSFGSSLWMMPFSKYCRGDNKYSKHFYGEKHVGHHTYHCDEQEFQSNFSGWPTNVINIEIPTTRGKIGDSYACVISQSCYGANGPQCLFVSYACRIWCISFILWSTSGQLVQHGMWTTYSIIFLSSWNIRWHLFQGYWRLWPRQQEASVPVREVSVMFVIIRFSKKYLIILHEMPKTETLELKLHFFFL